jgi:protein-L-isoaspartate(D-aspartate) O-methyltransferase
MDTLTAARRFFGEWVAASAEATDPRIANVFASIPREDFLGPGPWLALANMDYVRTPSADVHLLYQNLVFSLKPDKHINNGEPTLHARCLAAVAPQAGERVLQVGAGGGYYTAILASLVGSQGRVEAREVEPELIATARTNLAPYKQVSVVGRSGLEPPLPESDVIYVCAGATAPVRAWLDALTMGGRLIFPMTPQWGRGGMLLVTRRPEGFAARFVSPAWFIPCVGGQDPVEAEALRAAIDRGGSDQVRALHLAPQAPDETCWLAGAGWWLSTRDLA